MWAPSVSAAVQQVLVAAEEEVAVRVSNLLTMYAHEHPRHSTAQQLVPEQVLLVTPLVEVQISVVVQRQAWVRVSVALDERRA
jgi:hypothetical protein